MPRKGRMPSSVADGVQNTALSLALDRPRREIKPITRYGVDSPTYTPRYNESFPSITSIASAPEATITPSGPATLATTPEEDAQNYLPLSTISEAPVDSFEVNAMNDLAFRMPALSDASEADAEIKDALNMAEPIDSLWLLSQGLDPHDHSLMSIHETAGTMPSEGSLEDHGSSAFPTSMPPQNEGILDWHAISPGRNGDVNGPAEFEAFRHGDPLMNPFLPAYEVSHSLNGGYCDEGSHMMALGTMNPPICQGPHMDPFHMCDICREHQSYTNAIAEDAVLAGTKLRICKPCASIMDVKACSCSERIKGPWFCQGCRAGVRKAVEEEARQKIVAQGPPGWTEWTCGICKMILPGEAGGWVCVGCDGTESHLPARSFLPLLAPIVGNQTNILEDDQTQSTEDTLVTENVEDENVEAWSEQCKAGNDRDESMDLMDLMAHEESPSCGHVHTRLPASE
ncbi:MAG: hypothetical protein M1817_004166 [Caeruleum heppii]|nr:MAG: hypothetical protein M1817_004166 [Caeruleum heppii]